MRNDRRDAVGSVANNQPAKPYRHPLTCVSGSDAVPVSLPEPAIAALAEAVRLPEDALCFDEAYAAEADAGAWFVRIPERHQPDRRSRRQRYVRIWGADGGWRAEETESWRDYVASALPVIDPSRRAPNPDQDLLLKLYAEVGSCWRVLTDVRFKLMTLLPTVSVVAWGVLLASRLSETWLGAAAGVGVAYVGARFVSALQIYDDRNDELYDDLISRGRRIETELGVHTGVFRGRRRARFGGPKHAVSTSRIYAAARLGWWLVAAWFLAHVLWHAGALFIDRARGRTAVPTSTAIPAH